MPVVESSEVLITDFAALITPRFAVEVFPVPPLVEETVTLFDFVPALVLVTVTVTVQLPPTAMLAPIRLALGPFAAAVTVPPVQVVEAFGVAAFCKPVGYVSVNVTPVNATVFAAGFVIVNVSVLVPLTAIELGENDLTIEGGAITVVEALAVFPVPPLVEVTEPVMLFFVPALEAVTVTLKLHVPPPAIVAPLNEITPVAAVVVKVPPHCVMEESAIVKPEGRVSEKATPVSAVVAFGFVIVKLNVVVPPIVRLDAPNDLLIEGDATTVTVSEPVLLTSLISNTFPFGSTVAVFARLPAEVGVTAKVTLNDEPIGKVTIPLATQLKAVPVIEQLIVPVGRVLPFVTVNAPWG